MKVAVRELKRVSAKNCNLKKTIQKLGHKDYKIYNFLKKNPGVFAGTGAAFIAILSALITFCSYMYERATLNYWKIDPVYISISSVNRLYETIAAFIFICVLLVVIFVIDMIAEKTTGVRRKVLYLKKIKREYRKEVRKIRLQRVILWRSWKTKSTLLKDHSNKAKVAIEQLDNNLKETKKQMNRQIAGHLLLLDIVLTASMCILLWVGLAESSNTVLLSVISSMVISPLLLGMLYTMTRNAFANKKDTKNDAMHDYAELDIQINVPTVSLPLKKILSGQYSIKQPDHKIKRIVPTCLLVVVIVIAVLIGSFYFLGYEYAADRTQFMIITDQNEMEYAVVYNSGDNLIIAPCREIENCLIVDTAFQRVIPIEGLAYEVRQYEDAEPGSFVDNTDGVSSSVFPNGSS